MTLSRILIFFALWIMMISCQGIENTSSQIQKCIEPLTQKEKNYFLAIGFYDYKNVYKWDSDIRVTIKGNDIRDGDKRTIDTLIMEVAQLIQPLKISYTNDDDSNIIFILDKDTSNPSYAYGQTKPKYGFLNRSTMIYADILIFPTSDGTFRKRIMYHEMMHALGLNHAKFLNQPFELMNSIMMPYNVETLDEVESYLVNHHKFSELDKKMIKMLYNPCIQFGMKRSELYKIIQKHDKPK